MPWWKQSLWQLVLICGINSVCLPWLSPWVLWPRRSENQRKALSAIRWSNGPGVEFWAQHPLQIAQPTLSPSIRQHVVNKKFLSNHNSQMPSLILFLRYRYKVQEDDYQFKLSIVEFITQMISCNLLNHHIKLSSTKFCQISSVWYSLCQVVCFT